VLEAIDLVQEVTGEEMTWSLEDANRIGDHIWWISDNGRFASHYPDWKQAYDVRAIAEELYERNRDHWTPAR
jgi:CDP-paratose 2-epimerase